MKWAWHLTSIEIRKALSYRGDFWIQLILVSGAQIVASYFLWQALFKSTDSTTIGGLTFAQMMLYYVVATYMDRCVNNTTQGNIAPEIYDGSINRYLIYPLPLLGAKYFTQLAFFIIGIIQLCMGLGMYLLFFKVPEGFNISLITFLQALLTLWLATTLSYMMMSFLEFFAFWADQIWNLLVILRFAISFLGGTYVPMSLFPENIRYALELSPFPYLVSFPIRTLLGLVDTAQWFQGLEILGLWTIAFYIMSRIILSRGLRQYSGVGI